MTGRHGSERLYEFRVLWGSLGLGEPSVLGIHFDLGVFNGLTGCTVPEANLVSDRGGKVCDFVDRDLRRHVRGLPTMEGICCLGGGLLLLDGGLQIRTVIVSGIEVLGVPLGH